MEKTVPKCFIKQDLFGFADIIAINADETYLVQTTSSANFSARLQKILACQAAKVWGPLENAGHILLHGWSKKGARGKRKLWELREQTVKPNDETFCEPPY